MHKLILFVPLLLITACTTLDVNLPPITVAEEQRLPGKVIWHDLLTTDIEASRRFYGGLFGWEFEEIPLSLGFGKSSNYYVIRNQGRMIGGMLDTQDTRRAANNSQWITSIAVADIDASVTAAKNAGGTILTPVTDLSARGRIAVLRDSRGAVFAMLETSNGDPRDGQANDGDFLWSEVWTDDVAATANFYSALGPYKAMSRATDDGEYRGLATNNVPRFGLLQAPLEGLKPTWANYIKVADMTLLDKVEALGGKVLITPQPRSLGGEAALIIGPSGAGIALHTWPDQES
jgi:predicted enzyme related to lactoylglutathione lyase